MACFNLKRSSVVHLKVNVYGISFENDSLLFSIIQLTVGSHKGRPLIGDTHKLYIVGSVTLCLEEFHEQDMLFTGVIMKA